MSDSLKKGIPRMTRVPTMVLIVLLVGEACFAAEVFDPVQ